jgi:trimethylamine---corrinoid protein Co-methyltransferase
MEVRRVNYQVNATPTFQVLSDDEVEAIYFSSLRVLEETGVRCYNPEAVTLLQDNGAFVEDKNLVKLPSWMVEAARTTTPKKVTVVGTPDRKGKRPYRMDLVKNSAYFGNGSDTPYTIDPYTGLRRRALYKDVKNLAMITEAMPNLDFVMSLGITQDTAMGTYDRWQYLAMLEGTNKPINITAVDEDGLKDQLEMAYIRLGGKDQWKKHPAFSVYLEPVSPLSHDPHVIGKMLFCCDNDIPFVYTPCPMAGGTAPCTLAGLLVQALTESLFGLVISQLRRKGAQVIIGGLLSNMDMQTTIMAYGSPEMALLSAAYTDITKWLYIPMYNTACCSDAKMFDEQAVMEATLNTMIAILCGGNMIHDVGYIESGLTSSPDMLVASDEIISMAKRFMKGVPVTRDSVPLSTIDEVGPGGHYLGTEHTLSHFKTEFWRPKLADRLDWDRWTKAGSKTYHERVHQRVVEVLEAEHEPLFDDNMLAELRRVCELADERHKSEEIGVRIV